MAKYRLQSVNSVTEHFLHLECGHVKDIPRRWKWRAGIRVRCAWCGNGRADAPRLERLL